MSKLKNALIGLVAVSLLSMAFAPAGQAAPADHKQLCQHDPDPTNSDDSFEENLTKPQGPHVKSAGPPDNSYLCVVAGWWWCETALICTADSNTLVSDPLGQTGVLGLVSAVFLRDNRDLTDGNQLTECSHKTKKDAGEVRDLQCGNDFTNRVWWGALNDAAPGADPCAVALERDANTGAYNTTAGDGTTPDLYLNYTIQHSSLLLSGKEMFLLDGDGNDDGVFFLSEFVETIHPSTATTVTITVVVEETPGAIDCHAGTNADGSGGPPRDIFTLDPTQADGLRDYVTYEGVDE